MGKRQRQWFEDFENVVKVESFCRGCVKYKDGECTVFTEPFPLWKEGECWAREESYDRWLLTLTQIVRYVQSQGKEVASRLRRELKDARKLKNREVTLQAREAFQEDAHRQLPKPPRGEKKDRTHKLFNAQRMRDNRLIIPWTPDDMQRIFRQKD